ncbi:MAG: Gfo/Idh/MocA family oxidoreductase [Puniceicoccales bacterium]|jgi:predicted dehydrogenase|nr:Gfo/Idh/MocA family oxidoreductase [Puniceicoccales bacterium]
MRSRSDNHPLSRRRLFKIGGAAVFGALAFPDIVPASVFGAGAPSKRIHCGLVGCGSMGRVDFANITGSAEARAVAVCDVDASRRRAAAAEVNAAYGDTGCLAFGDFRELTRRADIDAVIVATPDHWHGLVALDAVRHGKDAYVEKPLTLTIEEGRVLADEARHRRRVVQTGSQQRSSRIFRHVCELVRNGRLGKISSVEVTIPQNNRHCAATWEPAPVPAGFDYDMWLGPAPFEPYARDRTHYSFRFILDYANGQITNFGAHDVDICQWALGRDATGPVEFEGFGEFPSSGLFTSPTVIDVRARYADGVELLISNHRRAGRGTVRFIGADGAWIDVSRGGSWASNPALLKEKIGAGEVRLYESRSHMGNFLECVRTRRAPVADVEIGHRTATICNAAMLSMRLRRPLRWDPAREEFVGDAAANRLRGRAMRGTWRLWE